MGRLWRKTVVLGLRIIVLKQPFDIDEYFRAAGRRPPRVREKYAGVRISDPLFFEIYLHYRGDIRDVLASVSTLPATPSAEIRSYACRSTSKRPERRKVQSQVIGSAADWYWRGVSRKNLQFYECMRFPDYHLIACDGKTGEIFHDIRNVRE